MGTLYEELSQKQPALGASSWASSSFVSVMKMTDKEIAQEFTQAELDELKQNSAPWEQGSKGFFDSQWRVTTHYQREEFEELSPEEQQKRLTVTKQFYWVLDGGHRSVEQRRKLRQRHSQEN